MLPPMARTREFDRDQALDRALRLLWVRGYDAASMDELLAVMALSKSSFYATFGSKHDLLLAALDRYVETVLADIVADLAHGAARDAVARPFQSIMDAAPPPRGCFVHNCALELAARDPDVHARVRRGLRQLERGFHGAIVRGQRAGEFSGDRDPWALARYLVNSLNGFHVSASVHGPARLRNVLDSVLSALG